ncbi:Isoquinoline 1-oxidoreductase subunit [Hyalangium rubrum]|uniref:Isoquinoline 1-oxidoreductase subunit n=1 Tax=Hyalangium rubrum TaxID=3103134 RepID=A0ABU5H9S4_9BACT|nr:Isoquinoline 1-oxidoreductase subunit [Hyalangium sp. s54d21]MDY7229573.1 Isoquinoline 1-oxidoreductase subunit [Hyalangium sp. s54d21]
MAEFSRIADPAARSVALFVEAGKVISHPRCSNCHPADGVPRQGMDQHPHVPTVSGGAEGHGTPGLPCTSCHRAANTPTVGATVRSIPGNPKWALAPAEMAWVGKSLGSICEQLKDRQRNGGKSLAELQHHMAEDALVGWGWNPGPGLEPVPGTQKAFGELIQAWIDTGAHCPAPY